ncbi:alpha/beta fold hydrolase [Pseudooceanicola algae]|uniref:Pyrethroid hydrolase n=1 Tax=Pseudooceanicola algae TaxID=1537215 RepID=A0A418SJG0_9RHOB|nr:alpha/beta fold hydrolase [Pseudooceanicola algae]QPM91873.1 Pyrethroid hydrolase [Pseudooceanicola algae]
MAGFLLIHGSCHGAWCWQALIADLARLGHVARAIDLPGRPGDSRPPEAMTLALNAEAILDATQGDSGVHLLGHSAAGFPISAAAEAAPDRFARLYYLAAYAPRDGLSMIDMRREQASQPLIGAFGKTSDGLAYALRPGKARGLFYHDLPPDLAAQAEARLCPEAIAPQATPIRLTGRYQSVPRCYIRCTEDRTIPPAFQAGMAQTFAPQDRYDMPTSHSPFLSDPAGLAALLHQIAGAN